MSCWLTGSAHTEALLERIELSAAERTRPCTARRLFALYWLLVLLALLEDFSHG